MSKEQNPIYKIHPAIGIARVGNSNEQFYLAPETTGALPIECTANGTPKVTPEGTYQRVTEFKDQDLKVKKQGARFGIYVYDANNPNGRPIQPGDVIQGVGSKGKLVDIEWTVWLANKKASWYQFNQLEGEHGYDAGTHPLRNASITNADERQKLLIIDPGPQSINCTKYTTASFAKGQNPNYAQTFPPPLQPFSIDTLGSIMTNDQMELVVLGGQGNSGTMANDPSQPRIEHYANNDGWFDDTSDGPVYAKLIYADERDNQYRYAAVQDPSWVVVGYPRYVPQIVDMVTGKDVLDDLNVRFFATNQYLYGVPPFTGDDVINPEQPAKLASWRVNPRKVYNENYYPYFYRDIWPILQRPEQMKWVTNFLYVSNLPHNSSAQGLFYPELIGVPPKSEPDPAKREKANYYRRFIYDMLRQKEEKNKFRNTDNPKSTAYNYPLMPLLAGDNPLTNTVPSKFLTLTATQLFMLKQWSEGKFINEKEEDIAKKIDDGVQDPHELDQGVISNMLGGSFCPGAEVTWIIRNPAIYSKPYRIKADPAFYPGMDNSAVSTTPGVQAYNQPNMLSLSDNFAVGLQPGDLTKRSAVPWQSDFNECSTQPINVTFQEWNKINPQSIGDTLLEKYQQTTLILWWPSHRPMEVYKIFRDKNGNPIMNGDDPVIKQVDWDRGIPQTSEGDLKMVTAWSELGFVRERPDLDDQYIEQERNWDDTISDQYAGPVDQ